MQKEEIISQLKGAYRELAQELQNYSTETCFAPEGEKWSMAQHTQHLIQSSVPVASLLKQPKEMIAQFGKPTQAGRSYEALLALYKSKVLSKSVKAGPPFVPKMDGITTQEPILSNWAMIEEKLAQRIEEQWTEEELDNYGIPHPVLGLFSVREMLFFTIFHTKHHLSSIRRIGAATSTV